MSLGYKPCLETTGMLRYGRVGGSGKERIRGREV